jgi:DNA-binding response OmpR family regulator
MALQTPRRLEVLVLAEEPVRGRAQADLALVARRITTVAEPEALLPHVWEQNPEVIIIQGPTHPLSVQTLCGQIRQFFQTPILIVEQGVSEGERISWLDSGADDVLGLATAGPAELSARCHALRRRIYRQLRRDPASLRLEALGMQLDIPGRRLFLAGRPPIDLSGSMTRLMALFLCYGEDLVPTATLHQHLFGASTPAARERSSALLQSFNRRMGELPGPLPRIERVRGSGYRLTLAPQ